MPLSQEAFAQMRTKKTCAASNENCLQGFRVPYLQTAAPG